ncbi:MAG: PDZ domain-containing protein [Pseudomonadota bacterium]
MRWTGLGLAAVLAMAAGPVWAQSAPVEYDLSFDNAVHHEARITVTYRDIGSGPLRLRMARSSPGRYATHEFAKNVYSVTAVNGAGRALTVDRTTEPYGWMVDGHDGTVSVTYTLYGDRADGTYAQIDASHAHLNMPATLMWAQGFDDQPVTLRFHPFDPSWRVATQLQPTDDAYVFRAPNLQYMMDSPTELSDHMMREWTVDDAGVPRTIRLALHHQGTAAEADEFARRARPVVDQLIAVFGDVPDYDFGTYTFLADYLPWASGDGMEHRNSTIISDTRSFAAADYDQLGTLSHEFFHSWNVERIRPAELEPFDFTRANPTPSLWFAEGFTNYYGPLAIRRAGQSSVDEFLGEMGGQADYVLNNPARAYGGPQEMSLRAPFVDAATAIDTPNPNVFASYYLYGATLAMALDLSLRERFPGVTLDDYMRHMWRTHGITERPYRMEDLRDGLAAVTGDTRFAGEFFARSIRNSELPDFAPLLAQAGILVRPARPARAVAGAARLQVTGVVAKLAVSPAPGSPLYLAGLDRNDEILSVGDIVIDSQADWDRVLTAAKPGDAVSIRFIQRGRERTATLTFIADPSIELVRIEAAGGTLTPGQQAFRDSWLGPEMVSPAE